MPRKKASKNKPEQSMRRKRTRAPAPVILKLHQDLEANESHPLAKMDARRRGIDRQHLIATILARIADGGSRDGEDADTMQEN